MPDLWPGVHSMVSAGWWRVNWKIQTDKKTDHGLSQLSQFKFSSQETEESKILSNDTKEEISFNFISGDKLELEEDGAIIKLHSLNISCDGGKYVVGYAIG